MNDILPEQVEKSKVIKPRQSVSAEAYGCFNKKPEHFKTRVIHKSQKVKEALAYRLSEVFMFRSLSVEELN